MNYSCFLLGIKLEEGIYIWWREVEYKLVTETMKKGRKP